MPSFFSKIAKLILWIFASTLFISGAELETFPIFEINTEPDYTIHVSGSVNGDFSGKVNFETSMVTTSKGVTFSVLKLRLDNKDSVVPSFIEFLIAKENTSELLPSGTYKVFKNKEGLLNFFDGVFGFANINELGESPLFAKQGTIRIDFLDKKTAKGKIEIQMTNSYGKRVRINGNFAVEN